jgi:hypothetical protein
MMCFLVEFWDVERLPQPPIQPHSEPYIDFEWPLQGWCIQLPQVRPTHVTRMCRLKLPGGFARHLLAKELCLQLCRAVVAVLTPTQKEQATLCWNVAEAGTAAVQASEDKHLDRDMFVRKQVPPAIFRQSLLDQPTVSYCYSLSLHDACAGIAGVPSARQYSRPDAGHRVPRLSQAGRQAGGRCACQLCHVDEHVRLCHALFLLPRSHMVSIYVICWDVDTLLMQLAISESHCLRLTHCLAEGHAWRANCVLAIVLSAVESSWGR